MHGGGTIWHLVGQPVVLSCGGPARAKVQWPVLIHILNISHVRPALQEEAEGREGESREGGEKAGAREKAKARSAAPREAGRAHCATRPRENGPGRVEDRVGSNGQGRLLSEQKEKQVETTLKFFNG